MTQGMTGMYESTQRSAQPAYRDMSPELAEALRSLDALRDSLQRTAGRNEAIASELIPVLHDVVKPGQVPADPSPQLGPGELASLRLALHEELDALIEDMLSDARSRFEILLEQSGEELKTAIRGRLEAHLTDTLRKFCRDA